MNWNFFKTNWFYLGMGLVFVLYIGRKYPRLNPFIPGEKNGVTEKISSEENKHKTGAALLGFVPDAPRELPQRSGTLNTEKAEAFLQRFANVAVSERKKFGIPSAVILAVACANSQAGQTEAAQTAHNFFALGCDDSWEGESVQLGGKCARKYETAWASFRDFSIFLSGQEWFGSLKKKAGKDWRKWAEQLDDAGIADAKAIRDVIETFKLNELD